jgi:hypothetical protein
MDPNNRPPGRNDPVPDLSLWMAQVRCELDQTIANGGTAGALEKVLEKNLRELGRPLLEEAMQKRADQQPVHCPRCNRALHIEAYRRTRNVSSVFGPVEVTRPYGWCPVCGEHVYPADLALGLQLRAPASPRVQEICALMVLESPAGQAEANLHRLTGLAMGQATMHREARRQGERAMQLREADVALTRTLEGVGELARRAQLPGSPFTLVIQIDAWNIRERDGWGESEALREKGEEPSRWHWVYAGTIFRLDQRGKTASGRSVITERGYVATRQGLESFEKQLYAEALQRGLTQAGLVLVIADGAIWIWNLVQNRFKEAAQRLDYWHACEHLWAVANDLYGRGTPEAHQWVRPLLLKLKERKNGVLDVISTLDQLRNNPDKLSAGQEETLRRESGYFETHKERMDYKNAKNLNQPLGSGAMESTCAQYQCRFKRTGQFWSQEGDEALLALATLHRNGRWDRLFPHDKL